MGRREDLRRRGTPGIGLGPEDAAGQVIVIGGVRYVADAEGELVGYDPERARALDEAITREMADPTLGKSPHGNPYR